jgi:hypothetical protein
MKFRNRHRHYFRHSQYLRKKLVGDDCRDYVEFVRIIDKLEYRFRDIENIANKDIARAPLQWKLKDEKGILTEDNIKIYIQEIESDDDDYGDAGGGRGGGDDEDGTQGGTSPVGTPAMSLRSMPDDASDVGSVALSVCAPQAPPPVPALARRHGKLVSGCIPNIIPKGTKACGPTFEDVCVRTSGTYSTIGVGVVPMQKPHVRRHAEFIEQVYGAADYGLVTSAFVGGASFKNALDDAWKLCDEAMEQQRIDEDEQRARDMAETSYEDIDVWYDCLMKMSDDRLKQNKK